MVRKFGFEAVRQKGSHIRFRHPDGRKTTIPDHGNQDVPYGLLLKIIKNDLEMDVETFFQNE
ncbi:MAG: type II toxin-antitoxin system HicA family toxin [Deltaproteobacteria bacterium]|jgi:predicted RNA binding protein YcfA (HicA-like mRNA interferase family)|nr:type II toxin-antitoxin system HicA family toxin [Deltaproteobacteria bacterium]